MLSCQSQWEVQHTAENGQKMQVAHPRHGTSSGTTSPCTASAQSVQYDRVAVAFPRVMEHIRCCRLAVPSADDIPALPRPFSAFTYRHDSVALSLVSSPSDGMSEPNQASQRLAISRQVYVDGSRTPMQCTSCGDNAGKYGHMR
jgi:hypothetical protein